MDERSKLRMYLQSFAPTHHAMCYMHPVEEALRAGKLKVYTLGQPVDNADLIAKANPYYDQLKQLLNQIIAIEEVQRKTLDRLYYNETIGMRFLITTGAAFKGLLKIGTDIADGIADTAEFVNEATKTFRPSQVMARLIEQFSKSRQNSDNCYTILMDFVTQAQNNELQELANLIGFDVRNINTSAIKEGFTIAAALLGDSKTYTLLMDFGKRFVDAQHHTELLHYGISVVFQVVIGAILAVFTGGMALVAGVAALARGIGQLVVKLGGVLVDLGRILVKKVKAKAKKTIRHNSDQNPLISKLENEVHSQKNQRKNEESKKEREKKKQDQADQDNNKNEKPNKEIDDSERILRARQRQQQMLDDNIGFNISPTSWDEFPSIGRSGTFISDQKGITDILGNFFNKSSLTIDKSKAIELESGFGLEKGTLQDGFKIRKVNNIKSQMPRSPMEGNQYFLGPGNHLPGGAPEMVIDSIPTADTESAKTILEVIVK